MRVLASLFLIFVTLTPAQARPHRTAPIPSATQCVELASCGQIAGIARFFTYGPDSRVAGAIYGQRRAARTALTGHSTQIVSHPPGCPRRAFCGCGAAVRVFGHPRRDLWLAANWLRFPRAAPAPGMVAARRGHVFVLESHVGGSTWIAYDANSGRHATRIHARSIAGYTIVNPRA